jgi:4-amino-4-deoxy-L-arabinose transferase-like glycosyltransferase
LTHGGYAVQDPTDPTSFLWRGPGLPLLIAPFVAIGGPIELLRVLVVSLVPVGVVVLWRALLRSGVSPRLALLGAILVALYLPLLRNVGRVMSEPVAFLCSSLAVLLLIRAYQRGSTRDAVLAGAAIGFLALTRLEFLYVIPVWTLLVGGWWVVRRTHRAAAIAGVVAIVVIVPWFGYAWKQSGRPLYVSNAGGLSLYWMASPYPQDLGDPWTPGEVQSRPELARHRPFFRAIQGRSPVAQDDALRAQAQIWMRHDPRKFAGNVVNNVGRMFFAMPFSFERQSVSILIFELPAVLLLLMVLAAAGLTRRPVGPWGPLLLLAVGMVLVRLPVGSYPRYLLPTIPIFATFALSTLLRMRITVPAPPGRDCAEDRRQARPLVAALPAAAELQRPT